MREHSQRATTIVNLVNSWASGVTLLNEVCYDTTAAIVSRLGGANKYDAHHTTTYANENDCEPGGTGNDNYGNAIIVRGQASIQSVEVTALRDEGKPERRKMTCVVTSAAGGLRACGFHITPDETFRGTQIREVSVKLDHYAASYYPQLAAGDLNVQPYDSELEVIEGYQESDGFTNYGDGIYNEPTFDVAALPDEKLDYTLVTATRFPRWGADATNSYYSDHDPLLASTTLRY